MLTVSGWLARFAGAERHKDGPISIVRASDKAPLDPAEQRRQEWEAIQRGVDELVAQLSENSKSV